MNADLNNSLIRPLPKQSGTFPARHQWVPETRLGQSFLRSRIWQQYVLVDAIKVLRTLSDHYPAGSGSINSLLDVGCGYGASFDLLDDAFSPQKLTAVDIDAHTRALAQRRGETCQAAVEVQTGTVYQLDFDSNAFDAVLCHQLLHHLTEPSDALAEIYRVLKPGGLLLLTESCAPFLRRWWVRWFFRHPDNARRSGEDYLRMVQECGFGIHPDAIDASRPWWSQFWLGLADDGAPVTPATACEIAIVAQKPAPSG